MNVDVSEGHYIFFEEILGGVSIITEHFSADWALFGICEEVNDFHSGFFQKGLDLSGCDTSAGHVPVVFRFF